MSASVGQRLAAAAAGAAMVGVGTSGCAQYRSDTPEVIYANQVTSTAVPTPEVADRLLKLFNTCEAMPPADTFVLPEGTTVKFRGLDVPELTAKAIVGHTNMTNLAQRTFDIWNCKNVGVDALKTTFEKIENGKSGDEKKKAKQSKQVLAKAADRTLQEANTARQMAGEQKDNLRRTERTVLKAFPEIEERIRNAEANQAGVSTAGKVAKATGSVDTQLSETRCFVERYANNDPTGYRADCRTLTYPDGKGYSQLDIGIVAKESRTGTFRSISQLNATIDVANESLKSVKGNDRTITTVLSVLHRRYANDLNLDSGLPQVSDGVDFTRTDAESVARALQVTANQLNDQINEVGDQLTAEVLRQTKSA